MPNRLRNLLKLSEWRSEYQLMEFVMEAGGGESESDDSYVAGLRYSVHTAHHPHNQKL
jgi:hypothetical protein